MSDTKERLVQWLRDAHAMERQSETLLKGHIKRVEHYHEFRDRMNSHLDETRRQAERLESCLDQLGKGTSGLKDAGAKAMGSGQTMTGMFASDEILNWGIAAYSFEHFEIASYEMLIAAAEACGETEVATICRKSLKEEETMASWLREHLRPLTREYLTRDEAELEASR